METIGNTTTDVWTRKYASDGAEMWSRSHDGPGSGDDGARGVAVDAAGNVCVAGYEAVASGFEADGWLGKYTP
jgi:hypothetical protein